MKYGKINSNLNGYVKKGVMYATYSALIGESQSGGKYKTRLTQLVHWCGADFDGAIGKFLEKWIWILIFIQIENILAILVRTTQ